MIKAVFSWLRFGSFAVATLVGAFLVFQVQPILSKAILPWFGGSPAVWTTCMLFFQSVLFGGYLYAHLLTRFLNPRAQGTVHLLLVFASMLFLPIIPDATWKPVGGESPTLRIVSLLTVTIGLPYFVLSATGPLMQVWFSTAMPKRSPYRLFALSNLGSLAALLSYPILIEPVFSIVSQGALWSFAFLLYTIACVACVVQLWQVRHHVGDSTKVDDAFGPAVKPNLRSYAEWLSLPAFASIMLLASTNHVCQSVSVTPFLWVLPLSLYLVTFIICFDNERWYSRSICAIGALVTLVVASLQTHDWFPQHIVLEVTAYFAALFFLCMLCHGELVRRKPHPKYLTSFYLCCSAGGAIGGLFVGLVCPLIFTSYFEMNLAVLIGYVISIGVLVAVASETETKNPFPQIGLGTAVFIGLLVVLGAQFKSDSFGVIDSRRSFYGVLTVRDHRDLQTSARLRTMFHGSIVHGLQFVSAERRLQPTTYYHSGSGVGLALDWMKQNRPQPLRVGVIGLGTGTLVAYGRKGDYFRFYEINPDVTVLADHHFSFLSDSPTDYDIVLGDARLSLEREASQKFDLLVLDAFSGDAIPSHLLTQEAADTYLRHVRTGGAVAIHVTNLHLDLVPVVSGLAGHMQVECKEIYIKGKKTDGNFTSHWMILSNDQQLLTCNDGFDPPDARSRRLLWTDGHNNLLEILKF